MSSNSHHLPIPPINKPKKIYSPSKSGSLIMKPQKGFIKSSTSLSKMPVLQRGQIMQTKPQSSRNSSVNNKHTSSLINIKSESQKTNSNEIRIRVFSNYGNPSFISCSEIDIINQERQKVQILSIKLEPKRNSQE